MGIFIFYCLCFLFVKGVFGAHVTVSMMKEDSVTLLINPNKTRGAENLLWKFEDKIIATIDLKVKPSQAEYPDERFTNRLYLNPNTGDLTINDIEIEDTGEYQLEIKTSSAPDYKPLKTFSVTVNEVESELVMKGETLTLNAKAQIQADDVIEWKFRNTPIAKMDRKGHPHPDDALDKRFRGRLHVDLFGSLTITHIKIEDSGHYDVYINNSKRIIQKRFRVTVIDEVKSESWMEGGSVILNTEAQIQADDVIEWKFKNTPIAKMDRKGHPHPDDALDKRFRGRLHVDLFGSLIIKHIKIEDSGHYDVYITNSKHIIQKRFDVTVTEFSPWSHQVKIGPGLFLVLIMLVIALV
ncbi:contactin-3-like [Paramisgurnus dabryanus]|uniref:contactin-3-like n=1 Tax=Paramisgurnus dabryanus TaxID=90735 RepID=UPI0031F406A1